MQDQLAALAYRVKQLEARLSLGSATSPELSRMADSIHRLEQRTNRSQSLYETGNPIYGGPIRTYNSKVMWTSGPFREDIDTSFPVEFDIVVSDNLLRIEKCVVRVKPVKIRNSALVAAAAAADTSGSAPTPSGGASTSGSTATASGGGATSGSTASPSGGSSTSGDGGGTTESTDSASHSHLTNSTSSTVTDPASPTDPHQHNQNDHDHTVGVSGSHNHDVEIPDHTHSTPNHTHPVHFHTTPDHTHPIHTHTTPNHDHPAHDHTVPGHGHNLTLGISEGGTAAGIRIFVDNVDRSAALGGPWSAAASFDIKQYLIDVRMKPVAGAHPIKFTVTSLGAIEVWMDWEGIVKA